MMVKTDVLLLTSHVMVSYTKLEGYRGGGLTFFPSRPNLNYLATLQQKWPKFLNTMEVAKFRGSPDVDFPKNLKYLAFLIDFQISKSLFLDHKIRLPQFVLNLMYVWRGIFAVIIIRIFVDMECTEGITLLQQVSKIRVLWRDQIIQAICTAEKSFAGWITTIQCLPSLATTKYQILFWIMK